MQCSGNWIRNTWWIPKAIIYSRCFIYNNDSCRVFISTCMPFIGRNVLSHLWNWTAPSSKFTWEGVSRYCWRKNIIVPHFPLLFFFSLPLLEDPAVKSLFSFAGLLWFPEFGNSSSLPGTVALFGPEVVALLFPALQNTTKSEQPRLEMTSKDHLVLPFMGKES